MQNFAHFSWTWKYWWMCKLHDRAPCSRQDYKIVLCHNYRIMEPRRGVRLMPDTIIRGVCHLWKYYIQQVVHKIVFSVCFWKINFQNIIIAFTVLVYYFWYNNIMIFHFDDSPTDLLWYLFETSWTFWEMILKKIRHCVVTECLKRWLISHQEKCKHTYVAHLAMYTHVFMVALNFLTFYMANLRDLIAVRMNWHFWLFIP
jgi:hypothetical protein